MTFFEIIISFIITHVLSHIFNPDMNTFNSLGKPKQIEELIPKSFHPRLAYGNPVSIEEFPYFASLENCGAAIISDRWVITAAHCIATEILAEKSIWLGGENINNSEKVLFDKYVIHPMYIPGWYINDIALLRLSKPLTFSNKIQPLNLPKVDKSYDYISEESYESVESDEEHVLVSRGLDETGKLNENIVAIDMAYLPSSVCYASVYPSIYSHFEPFKPWINEFVSCAIRIEKLPGAGYGDSGSPLVKNNKLIGVVSHGLPAVGRLHSRVVFLTNVTSYVPWIQRITNL